MIRLITPPETFEFVMLETGDPCVYFRRQAGPFFFGCLSSTGLDLESFRLYVDAGLAHACQDTLGEAEALYRSVSEKYPDAIDSDYPIDALLAHLWPMAASDQGGWRVEPFNAGNCGDDLCLDLFFLERRWYEVETTRYGLSRKEASDLVWAEERKIARKLANASITSVRQGDGAPKRLRAAIPDDVKVAVWHRDGGACVECDSVENLQYDHVIPHSLGGSDTESNIQLLCQPCNLRKSDRLTVS